MQSVICALACVELEYVGHVWQVFVLAPMAVEYSPTLQGEHASLPFNILNFPATHWVQVSPFGPVDPASQMHSALPFREIEFVWHLRHVLEVAPKSLEYSPVIQSEHAALPFVVLYFPATQCVQSSPSGPVDPALQVQSGFSSLPFRELESVGQREQSSLPADALYVPSEHSLHTCPEIPVHPTLHWQAETSVLALGETEFCGHNEQVSALFVLYFPLIHGSQLWVAVFKQPLLIAASF
jgi:hypothetical protein